MNEPDKSPVKTVIPFQHYFKGDKGEYLWIFIVFSGVFFLYTLGIGSYSLWDPWEPKYAQTVREMMDLNEFITPYLDGEIRWTKPILFYWAMYIPMMIFGNNEITARLPSVIAAILGLLTTYYFLEKLRGRVTAIIGVCILGTIPQYFYMARQAMPDMLMTFFLASAMGYFALGRFGEKHKKLYFALFYASVALAFLTKGPVTCVITMGAIILFWLININPKRIITFRTVLKDFNAMFKSYHVGLGIMIFIAIAGPWYIAMLVKHGYAFVDHFISYENIARFQEPIRGHHGTVSNYVKVLFHGMYPWSCMLPVSAFFFFYRHKEVDKEVKQKWYYLSWFMSIFIIFTFTGTKQEHYILPITPVVAVMVALVWEEYFKKETPYWIAPVFLFSIAFFLLPIGDFLKEGNKHIFDTFTIKRTINNVNVNFFLKSIFVAWAIVMILSCFKRRSILIAALAILIAYINGIYFCHFVMPAHEKVRTVKHHVERYLREKQADSELIFYGSMRHTLSYYYDKDIYHHFKRGEEEALAKFIEGEKNIYIIARKKYVRSLINRLQKDTRSYWHFVYTLHPRYTLMTNTQKK